MGVEVVEFLGAEVEEVDVKKDAVGGVVAGLADLVDLGLGEVGVARLGAERRGEDEK
jgi:chorismate synthase